MQLDASQIAALVAEKLNQHRDELRGQWENSRPVRHCFIDHVLPEAFVRHLYACFPRPEALSQRSSVRERKRFGVDVSNYDPCVGDSLAAFRDPAVIDAVAAITGIPNMIGDPTMYAGGISVMGKDDFLNPHLDNSHDGDQQAYRVINTLYYISPDWKLENGGNLELWDTEVQNPTSILSAFNRLVLMETNAFSWHSVSRVAVNAPRCCVSNYYFSTTPPGGRAYKHVTTFEGRPEEPLKRVYLKVMDRVVLNTVGKTMPFLVRRTKHRVKK